MLKQSFLAVSKLRSISFFKDTTNYLLGDITTKGIGFISVPIFTRLLTPADYGIIAVYSSLVSFLIIFLGLNFEGAITNKYLLFKEEFKGFLGTNIIFLILSSSTLVAVLLYYEDSICKMISIEKYVFQLAVFSAYISLPFALYASYLRAAKLSLKFSTIGVISAISSLVFSIAFILLLKDEKYLGRIYGGLVTGVVISIFSIIILNRLADFKWQKGHLKYALSFSIPLIPHSLAAFMLLLSDKLIINQLEGYENTGLYNFAFNIGMIMNVFVMATNKAWVPKFYELLKVKRYSDIEVSAIKYTKVIVFITLVIIFFSAELGKIMSSQSFHSALDVIPIVVLSYFFLFLYTLYVNYAFFLHKTANISAFTIVVGLINILLNYWLIPKFGYKVAAVSTLLCNFLLFCFHFINVKWRLKANVISINRLLPSFAILVLGITVWYSTLLLIENYYIVLLVKLIILSIVFEFLVKKELLSMIKSSKI